MPAVFLSNEMLQQWSDQGKVKLDDTVLTLLAEKRTVALTPAVRFTAMIDGTDEQNKLLGKVKTKAQLDEIGAEHYMDSVIIGDVGYTVVEGFLGDLSPVKRPPRAAPTTPSSTATAGDDPFRQQPTDVHLVAPTRPAATAAPAAVDLPPPPAPVRPLTEAEALSQLFLQTVRDK
jgi:hypothetical protein